MKHMQQLPIWRDANRLLLAIEKAVAEFPRYHKYTLGSDLRAQAMGICRLIVRAYNEKNDQRRQVNRLVLAVDDLKVQIQLAKELRVFRHFKVFQDIAELAVQVGRQSGGWRRRLEGRDSQNRHATRDGRAESLCADGAGGRKPAGPA
jgi:hypothetical protein